MALFQVDIEKRMFLNNNDYYWTNVYYVDAADQATAMSYGAAIANIERTVHAANVSYTKLRARPMPHGSGEGSVQTLSVDGTRATPSDWLPMYNTVRVDFFVPIGRPSRKYLRVVLGEADQTTGNLTSAFMSTVGTGYSGPMAGLSYLRDVDGQAFSGVAVVEAVQMRQLRRGSKRKLGPVI